MRCLIRPQRPAVAARCRLVATPHRPTPHVPDSSPARSAAAALRRRSSASTFPPHARPLVTPRASATARGRRARRARRAGRPAARRGRRGARRRERAHASAGSRWSRQHALARAGYFAGDDALRVADLNAALADPRVDAVWCLRGGYGAMRILDRVDFGRARRAAAGAHRLLRRHRAALRGRRPRRHARPGARHASRADRARRVHAVHAPLVRARAGHRRRSVRRTRPARARCAPGRARGRLAGGNLALLAALVGTPYAPRFDGAILVLEDVNEAIYRVDRMLRQLLLAGSLDGCRAIVFGQCTDCPEASDDGCRSLDDVVGEMADILRVPALAGVPVGHIDRPVDAAAGRRGRGGRRGADVARGLVDLSLPLIHSHAHKSAADLIAEAKQRITELTPQDVRDMQARGDDVRAPRRARAQRVEPRPHAQRDPHPARDHGVGHRDARAARAGGGHLLRERQPLGARRRHAQQMGYADPASMSGGFRGWADSGGEIED